MNNEAIKEILNELFSHLERLETQNEAILQFLKEKRRVTDKQLAPYLEQAGNASNVRWRAARVRIDHLLSPEEPEKEVKLGKTPELHEEPVRAGSSGADSSAASSVAATSEDKKSESDAQQDKRAKSIDQEEKKWVSGEQKQIESKKTEPKNETNHTALSQKEKPTPVGAVQARSADGKKDKPEERPESKPRSTDQCKEDQHAQKFGSDGLHHLTEATEPLAQQEGAEPPAQLKPDKTDGGKEAA